MGLGSCVGIALYDREKKIAGLVHIMLPDSKQFKNVVNPLKYADLGVEILFNEMLTYGCKKENIIAKIAGGASMFNFSDKKVISDIGKRNGEATINAIKKLSIPIMGEDIGGNKGRTMIVESEDGLVMIRSIGSGLKNL
ncbi:MAG: chemotaxis protein CheD [Clostridium sp.]|nr:chemotaxis protein CheD [Clostridium sp.]